VKVPPLDQPLDEVRRELDRIRHPFRIAVMRAKNPFNVGAIIRVAHSFLAREILLVGSEPYYERASMGMHRFENIVEIPTEAEFLSRAREHAWPLVSFEKDHAQVGLWDAEIPEDSVLVFGNEDDGLSAEVLAASRTVVGIPMYGVNHSYPVTAAAAIAMAEWARRHYRGGRLVLPAAAG